MKALFFNSAVKPKSTVEDKSINFIWGRSLLASEGESSFVYLQDHLATPVRLIGNQQQEALSFDEFGVAQASQESAFTNPFGFTGYIYDEIRELYSANARNYNPYTSRMSSVDSWGGTPVLPETLNKYTYCINNPVALVDRNGRFPTLAEIEESTGDIFNGLYEGVMDVVDFFEPASEVIDFGIKTAIFTYYPSEPQWWITGFNPQELFMPADEMVAIYTMDFSGDPGMFHAFMNGPDSDDESLIFNPFTYKVTFTFIPDNMEGACII